jgi:hypothetical protein
MKPALYFVLLSISLTAFAQTPTPEYIDFNSCKRFQDKDSRNACLMQLSEKFSVTMIKVVDAYTGNPIRFTTFTYFIREPGTKKIIQQGKMTEGISVNDLRGPVDILVIGPGYTYTKTSIILADHKTYLIPVKRSELGTASGIGTLAGPDETSAVVAK